MSKSIDGFINRQRYVDVARMRAEGLSTVEIGHRIGISYQQVSMDLKAIDEHWLANREREVEKWKGRELRRMEHLIQEAFSEWHRSKGERKKITQSVRDKDAKGKSVTKQIVTETTCGDPRYLDVVFRCSKAIRELFGLDEPARSETSTIVVSCKLPDGIDPDTLRPIDTSQPTPVIELSTVDMSVIINTSDSISDGDGNEDDE